MKKILLLSLFAAAPAWAQLPTPQPQPLDWFAGKYDVELRLKKADGTTARLVKPAFPTLNAQFFSLTEPCWNKVSACPEVTQATVKVFLKLPWSNRLNVTKYVLCSTTECQMPAFAPMVAKPGEGYRFRYDRVTAQLTASVVSMTAPPPPPPAAILVSPQPIVFNGLVVGPEPAPIQIGITTSTNGPWTSAETCPWFRTNISTGPSGAVQLFSPATGWANLQTAGTYTCSITYSSAGIPDLVVTVTAVKK